MPLPREFAGVQVTPEFEALVQALRDTLSPEQVAEVFAYLQPGEHRAGCRTVSAALWATVGDWPEFNRLMDKAGV